MLAETKYCVGCEQVLPLSAYTITRIVRNGVERPRVVARCRPCQAAYQRVLYRQQNPEVKRVPGGRPKEPKSEFRVSYYRPQIEREFDAAFRMWGGPVSGGLMGARL